MSYETTNNELMNVLQSMGIEARMVPAYQALMVSEDENGEEVLVRKGNKEIAVGFDCSGFVISQSNESEDITDEEMDLMYGGEYMDQQLTLNEVKEGIKNWLVD